MKLAAVASTLLFASFVTSLASAATPTVTVGATTRLAGAGTPAILRDAAHHPDAVNIDDCLDKQRYGMDVTVTGIDTAPDATLQAWAGPGDCSADIGACWPVSDVLSLVATQHIEIQVEDVLAHAADGGHASLYLRAGREACNGHALPNGSPIHVSMLLLPKSGPLQATAAFSVPAAIHMPDPIPFTITSTSNGTVHVTFPAPTDPAQASAGSMKFLCATTPACPVTEQGDFFVCGTPAASVGAADLSPLTATEHYGILAETIDDYGNASDDTALQCASPQSGATSPPSPGGCSASSPSASSSGALSWAAFSGIALGFFGLRRRRNHVSCRPR